MRPEAVVFASVAALLLATGAAHAAGPTQAELNNAANNSANWPYVDHDYRGQRYTPLDQITAKNAADVAQVCSHTFPDKEPAQTAPIVYDGTLYATTVHASRRLFASDVRNVRPLLNKAELLRGLAVLA
jgi:glucose dehydrogenase